MDIKALNTTFLDIDSIECNEGQIEGVPSNPRTISEERMEALKKSVEELPDMLSMRELLVYPNGGGRFVAIGGNQRLLVCRELGYTQMPVKIIPQETSAKTLMRIAMLDNEEFGKTDWEAIRENWDCEELKDWGIEIEAWDDEEVKREEKRKATEMLSELKFEDIYYTPKVKPSMKLEDCVDLSKFEAKVKALDEYKLTDKQKEVLKVFAYRFIKIDFESVANYYAFNASEEEKKAIERLRLVLVDNSIEGFINDDLLKVANEIVDLAKDED